MLEQERKANEGRPFPARNAGKGVDEVRKGAWWMPRLPQATKGAASCEKPRVGASGP